VDPKILEVERKTILALSPEYVGCAAMVPEVGCYYTLNRRDHAEMLVRDADRVRLITNICLHRNMQMYAGRGKGKALVCPMHRWSYDLCGQLLGAPHYRETPCMSLPTRRLQSWNGILFAGERDVANDLLALDDRPDLNVERYVLGQCEEENQPVNWKIPVEILLENYHVPIVHPGLARYVHPATWGDNDGSLDSDWLYLQEMKPHPDFLHNPASAAFERWQRAILEVTGGTLPKFAAIICLYTPNIFLEWYPFTFVVTTYIPRTPNCTLMTREFLYAPEALAVVPEFPELTKAAWDENQKADDHAHEMLQRGRTLRYSREPEAASGYEVYQSPMEDSERLFHAFLLRTVQPHIHGTKRARAVVNEGTSR
jgi:phenylpropionate dioxygenase-like ring-hydroxylating dioxygenase large terminal subunit